MLHAVLREPVQIKEAKLTQPMVNLFYVGSVLVCSFLNPKLCCIVWHDEFSCVCSKLGISLVSQKPPRAAPLKVSYSRIP